MVKLIAPMLSLEARGGLGKAITFRQNKGRSTCSRWLRPPKRRTPAQNAIRGWNRRLSAAWANLSTANQQTWAQPADARAIAPYHAYLSVNMQRWNQQRGASQMWPPAESIAAPYQDVAGVTTTVPGKITFYNSFFGTDIWGTAWYSVPWGAPPASRNDYIDFIPYYNAPFWGGHHYGHPLGIFDFYTWGYSQDGAKSNVWGPISRTVI